MPINKSKVLHDIFGDQNDGPDFSSFNGFLNAILSQHNSQHNPSPPPSHNPPPDPPPSHGHGPTLEFRSIDGSGNNLSDPSLNQAGTDFARVGVAHFGPDGDSMLPGPNAREISNEVVAGHGDDENPQGLSGMMYAWGQFIDHDLDLEKGGTTQDISITVPADDPVLPPGSTIPLDRVAIDPATGNAAHPATAINTITGWLDASMVYGSDQATADSLRTADGHMKTSVGNNLPVDPNSGLPMAGDVRAAENPDLTSLQTLFVREHNYQVDLAHQQHPNWTGDQLYQYAKAVVTAEIAHITYDEFLPHLLGANAITPYQGYNPNVDPTITEEFEGAAYRFGHSIVSGAIEGVNNQGVTTSSQDLANAFFEPEATFAANGGPDGLLRHLTNDPSNKLDTHIIDDLRNFLAAPPDFMDLAAINIERGRDLGLGTLNDARIALGLQPYQHISDITTNQDTVNALNIAYGGDVNAIDLWVGGLAEDPSPGAMIGPTFGTIIAEQFENLRDGDRLFYENQGFDAQTLATINNTTLTDIIERNTDTTVMQDDAFVFYDRHGGTQSGMTAEDPDAPQLVVGSKGFDTLIGGPQGDMLVAATGGTQTMTGGSGGDQFIVDHNMTVKITDFHPGQDKIVFDDAGSLGFSQVHIKADHNNTVIEANGNHITLLNVNPLQLHATDFIYHH
ncbi:MAG TPA: peroxidase family protein [Xanthobacteraceae bacterium]|nr:peroxidase family protein [Xanthobacteraceae bacterium]